MRKNQIEEWSVRWTGIEWDRVKKRCILSKIIIKQISPGIDNIHNFYLNAFPSMHRSFLTHAITFPKGETQNN